MAKRPRPRRRRRPDDATATTATEAAADLAPVELALVDWVDARALLALAATDRMTDAEALAWIRQHRPDLVASREEAEARAAVRPRHPRYGSPEMQLWFRATR